MFDDIQSQSTPTSVPQPPRSSAPTIPSVAPKPPTPSGAPAQQYMPDSHDHGSGIRKILMVLILIVVVVFIGIGGYLGYKKLSSMNVIDQEEALNDYINQITPIVPELTPEEKAAIENGDQDNDGLKDDEEKLLGTSINDADTDGDGVSDFDEVKIYFTDPLDPDSDGDGYSDGEEIQNGYNPNGPGVLLNFENERNKIKNNAD